jgi:hypothetical protein
MEMIINGIATGSFTSPFRRYVTAADADVTVFNNKPIGMALSRSNPDQ